MSYDVMRRTLLATVGTIGTTALAGCGGQRSTGTSSPQSESPDSSSSGGGGDVVADTQAVPGQYNAHLRVSVTADAQVDAVALKTSSGIEKARQSLGTGSTVKLSLDGVSPGTHTLVALRNGETVATNDVSLERELTLSDLEMSGTLDGRVAKSLKLTLKNTGDFQLNTSGVTLTGVPEPITSPHEVTFSREVQKFGLQPQESATAPLKYASPFSTGWLTDQRLTESDCDGDPRTATLTVHTKSGYTETWELTYTLGGQLNTWDYGDAEGCTDWSLNSWEKSE